MSDTVDIGAARVRLIVDAADFEPVIEQGKRAIRGFGAEAQTAYDKTEKSTRRAADALLDYVNSLGRTDSAFDKYLRNASRVGVEKPVLDAAIQAWGRYSDQVEQAAAAQKDLKESQAAAQAGMRELLSTQKAQEDALRATANAAAQLRIENLAAARAASAQQSFNSLVAPGLEPGGNSAERRSAAEAAFAHIIEQENVALAQRNALEAEAYGQNARVDSFLKELENTQKAAGKTYYELLQLKAAELGVSEQAAPLIAGIQKTNKELGAGTISAKQYEFALRGLPAQFTDVFVSLAAGQNPLTVLLQQGGQVKDMFGGIKTAAVAVGKELAKLATNPWVLLATVIAGVAYAAYTATSRLTELSIATAKGNQVAGSAHYLSALAEQLNKIDNISLGNADAALTKLAEGGRLTGDQLAEAAQAAARWATITGQGVDDVVAKFNELAADPMAAVLNGTLRVTAAQYEQLAAYERVGNKVAEVALAVQLYQGQVNDNSASVLANLSEGAKGWNDLKDAISGAAHEFSKFVTEFAGSAFNRLKHPSLRDFSTAGMSEGALDLTLNDVGQSAGATPATSGQAAVAVQAAAAQKAKQLTLDQIAANKANQASYDELGTKQQKFTTGLERLNVQLSRSNDEFLKGLNITRNANGTFSGAGYDKLKEGLRLKIFGQDPKNAGGDPTKPIKEWEKTALDTIKNVQQAQDYLYSDGVTSIETYYSVARGLARSDEYIQLQSIDKQIAALKGRENSEASIAALVQQKQTVEQQYAEKKGAYDRAELLAIRQRQQAYRDYTQQLADSNIQLARQGEQAVAAVGMGSQQAALAQALANARFQESQAERAAQQEADDKGGGAEAQADADRKKQAAAESLTTTLLLLQGNYDNLREAETSWTAGSTKAWQDWYANVVNYAEEASRVTTGFLNDLTDSLTTAATEGSLSFTKLLKDIEREIVQSGIKTALASLGKYIGGGSGDSSVGSGFEGWATTIGRLIFSAKGNAFSANSGLAGYSNTVVSQPTYFPFAKGGVPNVGLMGEKSGSPGEAIMPLVRTSGGELAVKSTGQQQARPVVVNQTFIVPGAQNRSTQDQLSNRVYGSAQRAARRG